MWRVIWDGGRHKDCGETSLKYEGVGPDLVTTINADWGQVLEYYTQTSYTSTSTFVKWISAYEGDLTDFCTDQYP